MSANPFEEFALVELFGHNRIAGKVTEAEIGGGRFIRVDVPAIGDLQPITRYYSPSAIYGITPLSEATAVALATQLGVQPVNRWDVQTWLDAQKETKRLVSRSLPLEDDGEYDPSIPR